VYRARVALQVPTSITDADNIVNVISKWVQSKPSVMVNKVILEVDPDCPAMLDSLTSDDCVTKTQPTDQVDQPSSSSSSSSSSLPVGIIVGAAVAGVVILLLIISIIVIVTYRRRKSSYRY